MKHKSALKSKTIWGIVIAAMPVVAGLLGVSFSDAETQQLTESFITIFGLAVAAYGRAVATGPLTKLNGNGIATMVLLLSCSVFAAVLQCDR